MTAERDVTGRPVPAWGRRVAAGAAVVTASALLASVALSAFGPDTADAATTLAAGRGVDVVLSDGSTRLLDIGQEVPRGATVRTGKLGAAMLVTRGREVLLGASTSVTVVDGARQVLGQGQVLVNAAKAPGVTVDGAAGQVAVKGGGLTRIERGPAALRVAVFDGESTIRSAGRSSRRTVDELFQVQVPYGGLSGTTTPLALTPGDSWEERYALDLVQDDRDLRALASGLDASSDDGSALLAVAPASVRQDVVAGAPRSEQLVGYLLATEAKRGGRTVDERYANVRGYRLGGGSWGVVAALVDAGADSASRALDAVLSPDLQALPDPGASGAPIDPSVILGPSPTGGNPRPSSSRPSGGPSSTPPIVSPPSSPDPVKDVIDTVLDLLPTPVPTPAAPGLPTPSPGLLGTGTGLVR